MPQVPWPYAKPEALPGLSISAGGSDIKVKKNKTKALTPGSYGKVEVEEDGTLQLSTGDYFIEELILKKNVDLEIDLATGPVAINVEKKIDVDKNLTTTLSPLGDVDSRYVTFAALEDVSVGQGSKLVGQVITPRGKVDLKKNVTLLGSICAEEVDADRNDVLVFHDEGFTGPSPSFMASTAAADVAVEVTQNVEQAVASPIVETAAEVPAEYRLYNNYPNPFNHETRISYGLPESAHVKLTLYDMLGRRVRVLVDGVRAAGTHEAVFDASPLPSGTYLYRLDTPAGSFVGSMLLVK